jgi:3-hydroxyisobutyrate dehydrogenase
MTAQTETLKAGVIGLGQMGGGIAANLARAGLLAGAWDVMPAAWAKLASYGSDVPWMSPAEMGAQCDIILFVVPASPDIEACLVGDAGILASSNPGQVLLDLTTSYPTATHRLIELAGAAGRGYLDAGMTGGAAGAESGKLTLMLGGDAADLARARPVLDAIAAKTFHVGGGGAGHTMKLVHNMICHTIFLTTVEGCRMAELAGLDLKAAIEVINAGNARSFISEARFPNHILSGSFDGRSRVSNLAKDLRMAADFAEELGASAVYGPLTAGLLDQALQSGFADDDFTTLYKKYEALVPGVSVSMRTGEG